jgi:lipoprotein-releasing system permease protein
MKNTVFTGMATALVTPMHTDGSIDYEAFGRFIEFQIEGGINALVVMVIMIIVALLNMTTALLVIVLERQRMIGELRALGMQRISIIKLFLYRAMFIMCRGIAWGTILGIILVIIQYIWAPMPLPNEGYILTHVPVVMCWGWWLVAVIATVAVSAVVMVIPALFATKSAPAEALRYE